jgi:hypothetical protein
MSAALRVSLVPRPSVLLQGQPFEQLQTNDLRSAAREHTGPQNYSKQ